MIKGEMLLYGYRDPEHAIPCKFTGEYKLAKDGELSIEAETKDGGKIFAPARMFADAYTGRPLLKRDIDDNKKYVLDVNKSKMYALVQEFSVYQLPDIEETEYTKTERMDAYWLRFLNEENQEVVAYLDRMSPDNLLRIGCEADKYEKMYHPSSEKLLEKDLLKRVEKKKERKITK